MRCSSEIIRITRWLRLIQGSFDLVTFQTPKLIEVTPCAPCALLALLVCFQISLNISGDDSRSVRARSEI
jgi:hypothetical protein